MYTKTVIKKLLHFSIPRLTYITAKVLPHRVVLTAEIVHIFFKNSHFLDRYSGLNGIFSGVYKNHNLVALRHQIRYFLKSNAVEIFA